MNEEGVRYNFARLQFTKPQIVERKKKKERRKKKISWLRGPASYFTKDESTGTEEMEEYSIDEDRDMLSCDNIRDNIRVSFCGKV